MCCSQANYRARRRAEAFGGQESRSPQEFLMRQPAWGPPTHTRMSRYGAGLGSSPTPDRRRDAAAGLRESSLSPGRPSAAARDVASSTQQNRREFRTRIRTGLIVRCHGQCLYFRDRSPRRFRDWCGSFVRDDLAYPGRAGSCSTLCPGNDSPRASVWRVHRRGFETICGLPCPSARRSIKVCPALRTCREIAAALLLLDL